MAYDLLITNGRIVDGSGGPAFKGDVAVKDGKIAEIGKLAGAAAKKTVDAEGRVVAPGFIDNHCHYDAQVTWDPLCSYSCDHGATSVIFGNCSLSLAPVHKGDRAKQRRLSEFLSYVEAIPMEVLDTLEFTWERFPEYLEQLDHNLGVNVGNLVGHTAVRYYVMGDACQERTATDDEIKEMQGLVREGIEAGALGLSVSRNQGHYDPQGVHIPALWADEKEIFALGDVLRELGTGLIQSGGGNGAETKDQLMSRLSEATGRTVVYNNLTQSARRPDQWTQQIALLEETAGKRGIRAFPMCTPNRIVDYFTLRNTQEFRGLPVWHPICLSSPEAMLKAYADPEIRKKLHAEAVDFVAGQPPGLSRTWWDYMELQTAVLPKNKWMEGRKLGEIAKAQGKGVIDCLLDLAVEEHLDTEWLHGEINVDDAAVAKILTYPYSVIGLSDSGAHVQFQSGFGFSTRLLSEFVRDKKIMSLETAVRRLTFESASIFGLYDRGLIQPGKVADLTIFDPDTVKPLPLEVVHDFPTGAKRIKEPAQGIYATFVNGEMLMQEGRHTGALPGRVLRNTYYKANHA